MKPNGMNRFFLILRNDLKLVRTSIPVHIIAIAQPTFMYILMSVILVHPTFDMYVTRPTNESGWVLVAAMEDVGSPIGEQYINPVLIEAEQPVGLRQVVTVEEREGRVVAIQQYGLIDSNIVKNFKNRLTAAGFRVWNDALGGQAVQIREHPWLPKDMPYTLYFGMAMLPLTVALAASIIGGTLTAQEFEYGTILEYRLAPVSAGLIIATRLVRLVFTGLLSAFLLLVTLRLVNGVWPASIWKVGIILVPVGVIAGSLGISAGLFFQKSIPTFLVGLVTSFAGWLIGSAFGLAAGFNQTYEFISRLTPNTHVVELLYPLYFGTGVGVPWFSILFLVITSLLMVCLAIQIYRLRVLRQI